MKSFHRRCRGLLLAPLLLALPACQRPEETLVPADLLPKEKMTILLTDLHVLEARVESSRLQPDSARALYLSQHERLLKQNQVTDSAFQRSYRYYGGHGKDLNDIYSAVVDTLNARSQRADSAAGLLGPGRPPQVLSPPPQVLTGPIK
ncbi:DUF4296 domain-containing protein [Hymenobacter sp. IS2118]|uniref:DUF4296 domain-containing protein n=1 Tax=Hymenobacter sp. IS2118 TaxID=1505605 RepID=UPI00068C9284|nr:DUF4296 domain-containing protein [Hymenobacter sp. IS2118]